MADSHPFANAGLGMFGSAERRYAQAAMHAKKPDGQSEDNFDLLGFLGGLIGLSDQEKARATGQNNTSNSQAIAPPKPQYEPQTAFPEVLQQQYATPYKPGYGGVEPIKPTTSLQGFMTPQYRAPQAPAPADPMAGFKTPNQFTTQPQVSSSGYHPVTDSLWAGR